MTARPDDQPKSESDEFTTEDLGPPLCNLPAAPDPVGPASPLTPPAGSTATVKVNPSTGTALTPSPLKPVTGAERMQGAKLLREWLSCVPWHAAKAAKAEAETGDPMRYWLRLHGGCATIQRRIKDS